MNDSRDKKKCLLENNDLSPKTCFVVTKCDHVYKDEETHASVERVVLSLICAHSNTKLGTLCTHVPEYN